MSVPNFKLDSDLLDMTRLIKPFVYRHVDRPPETVFKDIPYTGDSDADDKRRLNLFVPDNEGWPAAIFIHGGGWTTGDRNLEVVGEDVYGNIGRYFAHNGIGCAVISYRLMPNVHWRRQFEDVAAAVRWVQRNQRRYGGDGKGVVLVGHSAGAHLAARVVVDRSFLSATNGWPSRILGVVSVSGGAFDMGDEETYRLGADFNYVLQRFGQFEEGDAWIREASVVPFIDEDPPPFLFVYGGREEPGYGRQADVLADALRKAGGAADIEVARGLGHRTMVVALSRDQRAVGKRVVQFILERAAAPVAPPKETGLMRSS